MYIHSINFFPNFYFVHLSRIFFSFRKFETRTFSHTYEVRFATLENMWKIPYLNAKCCRISNATIFKQGAQRHALMRWRAALDKVSLYRKVWDRDNSATFHTTRHLVRAT